MNWRNKKIWTGVIIFFIIFALTGLFWGYGIGFFTPMEINCEKYGQEVCHCLGIIYKGGEDCSGARVFCKIAQGSDICMNIFKKPKSPTLLINERSYKKSSEDFYSYFYLDNKLNSIIENITIYKTPMKYPNETTAGEGKFNTTNCDSIGKNICFIEKMYPGEIRYLDIYYNLSKVDSGKELSYGINYSYCFLDNKNITRCDSSEIRKTID